MIFWLEKHKKIKEKNKVFMANVISIKVIIELNDFYQTTFLLSTKNKIRPKTVRDCGLYLKLCMRQLCFL